MFSNLNRGSRSWIVAAFVWIGAGGVTAVPAMGDGTTAQPTPATQPASVTPLTTAQQTKLMALNAQLTAKRKQFDSVVGDGTSLKETAKKAEVLSQLATIWDEIASLEAQARQIRPPAATQPSFRAEMNAFMDFPLKMPLIAVGDQAIIDEANAEAASTFKGEADIGKFKLLGGEWLADPDEAAQLKTSDRIVALLKTADANDRLFAIMLANFIDPPGATTAAREKLASTVQANYASENLTKAIARIEKHKKDELILTAVGDKPLALSGTTVDGKPFSTGQWNGKVILVDFWASWCVPCKEELPRVKAMYQKYHDQGLEVLGVSNDYTKAALQKYLAGDPALAWPCLFDEASAENQSWNPLSVKYGVDSIPRMFLIDRSGICRTVEARDNMETMIPRLLAEPEQAISGTVEPSKTAAN